MTIGMLFWLLMVLWIIFGLYTGRAEFGRGNYTVFGGNLLLFILLFLLGWATFGFIIKG